jgi:hypothetical protein
LYETFRGMFFDPNGSCGVGHRQLNDEVIQHSNPKYLIVSNWSNCQPLEATLDDSDPIRSVLFRFVTWALGHHRWQNFLSREIADIFGKESIFPPRSE